MNKTHGLMLFIAIACLVIGMSIGGSIESSNRYKFTTAQKAELQNTIRQAMQTK